MNTIHISSTPSGEWSVELSDIGLLEVFPTEGQAVARAWDVAKLQPETALIVQSSLETMQCRLTIRRADPIEIARESYEDAEDEVLSREAERLLPGRDQIRALMNRLPPSTIDYSLEDDELPC